MAPCPALLTGDVLTMGDMALPSFFPFGSDARRPAVVTAPVTGELGWHGAQEFERLYTASAATLGAGSFGKVRGASREGPAHAARSS